MAKTALADHLNGFELNSNPFFNPPTVIPPGGFVSVNDLPGYVLLSPDKTAPNPAEIINGPYLGMPAQPGGHHYADTLASPGPTLFGVQVQAAPGAPLHYVVDVYYQQASTLPGQHTDMHDSLTIDTSGQGFGTHSVSIPYTQIFGLKDASQLPAVGAHGTVSIDLAGASDGNTLVVTHETGPGTGGNIGAGLIGMSIMAYDVFHGQHF